MSDWTWEYVPDAAHIVGGLTPAQIGEVESLAARIATAVRDAATAIGTVLGCCTCSRSSAWPSAAQAGTGTCSRSRR
jgi:hypothetical protein